MSEALSTGKPAFKRTQSEEECHAVALLLGYEYLPGYHWYRVRVGPNRFLGMADFYYVCAESMKQVVETRSEIDIPWRLQRPQPSQ